MLIATGSVVEEQNSTEEKSAVSHGSSGYSDSPESPTAASSPEFSGSDFAVFIDSGYLDKTLEHNIGATLHDVDWRKLVNLIIPTDCRPAVYFYDCLPHQSPYPTSKQRQLRLYRQELHNSLRQQVGAVIRLGRLACRHEVNGRTKFVQKQVDVAFGIDLVRFARGRSHVQASMIMGDSDYLPALTAAREEGIRLHVFYEASLNWEIRAAVDGSTRCDALLLRRVLKTQ